VAQVWTRWHTETKAKTDPESPLLGMICLLGGLGSILLLLLQQGLLVPFPAAICRAYHKVACLGLM